MRARSRLPVIWYALAAGTALAALALGLWALQFNKRLEDELVRAARAQSEVLARDFGEEFLARHLNASNAIFRALPLQTTWSPAVMDTVFARARSAFECRCQPAYVAHAAFLWSSRDPQQLLTRNVDADRIEALRVEVAQRANLAPSLGAVVLMIRSGPHGGERFGLALFQRLPGGILRAVGFEGDEVHPWIAFMQGIIDKVGGTRLGEQHAQLAAWRVISPTGQTFFKAGVIDPALPAVRHRFGSRQFVAESLPQHLSFLTEAPLATEIDTLVTAPSDPATTPWIVVAQVSPLAMANALYGSDRVGLSIILALIALAAALSAAMISVARRLVRQVAEREAFATAIAHDLRTPLTQILLHAESLQLGRAAEETRRDAARVIAREARRLVHLAENALTFVRRKGSPPRLAFSIVDPARVVEEVLATFEPTFARAEMQISAELTSGLAASLDHEAFSQVLGNLLENAIRFGPKGQVVAVTVTGGDGSLAVTVRDQGPGIPAAERSEVFHPFVRGKESGGTGIGLAVARQLVELMNGQIEIRDPRGGHGAEIAIVFPLVAQSGASAGAERQAVEETATHWTSTPQRPGGNRGR